MTAIPAPGSAKAVKMGCTCPVLDNAHGRGYMGGAKGKNGETLFVVSGDCPIHNGKDENNGRD